MNRFDDESENPLDILGLHREHIIALHEAYTHTNKKTSTKRSKLLFEILEKLKHYDQKRNTLYWEQDDSI